METENLQEQWQVEAGGKVYDTSFDEMTSWIAEGSLLKIDRVRKGNLRWIEACKVPSLTAFFNAKDASDPKLPVVTTSASETPGAVTPIQEFADQQPVAGAAATACSVHSDQPAAYLCETCANLFCKGCPTSYGAAVRICPFCGAMCKPIAEAMVAKASSEAHHAAITEGFGFGDLGRALAYPFKFKTSFVLGAVMFMFFSLGQSAGSFGGLFMLSASLVCFMLTNTLTFGILANTVENFSHGKLDENFMPSFDDFSLWDDVVHPFFLSIGVYVSSFLPFFAVVLIGVFVIAGASVQDKVNEPLRESREFRELVNRTSQAQQQRVSSLESGSTPQTPATANTSATEDESFGQLNAAIQQQRKAQLESALGKAPDTEAKERAALARRILGYGAGFLLFLGLTFLWGCFYLPAACAVAGYTRSFSATINPVVVLDTIRHLGSSYFLVLVMAFILSILSGAVLIGLGIVLSAFDMPGVGNLPAKATGSIFTFYFSIVFSCVLGYALYKGADRLHLGR